MADIVIIDAYPRSGDNNLFGQKLCEVLSSVGISVESVYVTSLLKEKPVNGKILKKDVDACGEFLKQEIQQQRPKVIVPMDSAVLSYFFKQKGIGKVLGVVIDCPEYTCKIVPAINPVSAQSLERFATLVRHFKLIKDVAGGVYVQKSVKYVIADTMPLIEHAFKRLSEVSEFSCDTETDSFDFLTGEILCVSFSWQEYTGVVIPLVGYRYRKIWTDAEYKYIVQKLKEILENPVVKIFQNGAFDIKFFKRLGIFVNNYAYDTMLMHHVLDENALGMHGLKDMAARYTDMGIYDRELELFKDSYLLEKQKERRAAIDHIKKSVTIDPLQKAALLKEYADTPVSFSYADIPEQLLWKYAAADVDATLRLKNLFDKLLQKETMNKLTPFREHTHKSLSRLFHKIIMPQRAVLNDVEYRGVLIDREYMVKLAGEYQIRLEKLYIELRLREEIKQVERYLRFRAQQELSVKYDSYKKKPKLSKSEFIDAQLSKPNILKKIQFNPESNAHKQVLLYNVLNFPIIKFTKSELSNPAVDKEVLNYFVNQHTIINGLLEYSKLSKLYNTYLIGMQDMLDANNRLHTTFKSHGTVTGRLSSISPNLQNIPSKKSDIKGIFIAPPGCKLIEFDFAQAEFRGWALYSQDPDMIRDIKNGLDIHRKTAADCLGIPIEQVTTEQRSAAKSVVFGLMYGRGAASVAKQVGISIAEAEKIIAYFFAKYPVAAAWLEDTKRFAKQYGYVVNYFGRIRRLPGIHSNDYSDVAEAERQATNSPIQGVAADITGLGLIRISRKITENNLDASIVLTVHDSIVIECREEQVEEVVRTAYHELTRGFEGCNIPFEADIKVGDNWRDLVEYSCKNGVVAKKAA